jgi:hypothetical protein
MGSLLNALICLIHYSWANSRSQIVILGISLCFYFYNYDAAYKEFVLANIFLFNLIQIIILNESIRNPELVRFLTFYNISNTTILVAKLLVFYVFILSHSALFFLFSRNSLTDFIILNLLFFVIGSLKIYLLDVKRYVFVLAIILLCTSQITILLFLGSSLLIILDFVLILVLLGTNKFRFQNKLI